MAVLAEFPPEILSIVSSSLNGFDITRLWLSGDRMLIARLELGVTHFDLALAQTVNCSWPAIISRFSRLESLSIRPRSMNHRLWFRDVDFYGISSSLKHMELEFDNLEFSLFGLPFVVSDAHPDPIWSPQTEGEMFLSPFPLATHFDRLETIRFRSKMKFPSLLIPMLPSGLLWLDLPYLRLSTAMVRRLPPNLTRLELPQCHRIQKDEIGLQFPLHITHLDLGELYLFEFGLPTCLPPSLIYLHVRLGWSSELDSSALRLPPTLVTLVDPSWSAMNKELFETLPTTLLHLDTQHQTLPLEIEKLPPGLQTLATFRMARLSDATVSHLPSSLTELTLFTLDLAPESILSYPPCLRFLTIRTPFVDLGTPYPFMNCLEYLDVSELDPSVLSFAPKLRFLDLLRFMPLSQPKLGHLTSLTTLAIGNGIIPDDEPFPDSLTALTLPKLNSCLAFQQLPPGLQMLTISVECDVSEQSMALLPHGLTELNLPSNDLEESISDASLALLPRSLEVLTLGNAGAITDQGISNLPSDLRLCSLANAPHLTDSVLFPRQLTSLDLESISNLSNACAKHLPRTLTRLNIQSSKFTIDCFSDLPPLTTVVGVSEDWPTPISRTEQFLRSWLKDANRVCRQ